MAVTQSLSVTEVSGSVNTAANTSKVRILWKSTQSGESWNGYSRTAKYYVSVNGGAETEHSVSYTLPKNDTTTILDVTTTVTHKSDGSGTIKVRTWMDTDISAGVVEKSQTITLTTIPRASTLTSASNITLGKACSVKWTPKSTSFRYKLKFTLGNWSYTTGAIHPNRTSAYTYTGYTIPLSVASEIPNSTSGTMAVALYTYSDSGATSQVGSASSLNFTVTVPDNDDTKPSITNMTLTPVSSLGTDFEGMYIQGLCKVKVTSTESGKYGATVVWKSVTVEGRSYGSSSEYTSNYLSGYGLVNVKLTVKDSRGITNSKTLPINVVPYSKPRVVPVTGSSSIVCARCDSDGNLSDSGTYLRIKARRSFSLCMVDGVQKNFCGIRYRYKKTTDSAYSSWVTIMGSKTATSDEVDTIQFGGGLVATSSYIIHIDAVDTVGYHTYVTFEIPTDSVYMHRAGSRNSLGLGKYAEHDNALDTDWDIYMNKHRITGLPTPTSSSDAVPMSYVDPADIKMEKNLNTVGWYKIGTISGEMCGVITITVGGIFVYNQASPSMVDIATQYNNARAFLRLPSLADSQISKIGVIKESVKVYGVYAHYNTSNENPVSINIHTHMGAYTSADFVASNVSESDMLAVVNVKA